MFSASLVQLGTTTNYITVEEKFLDFVLVYELACTELHELYIDTIVFSSLAAIRICPRCNHLQIFEFLCVIQVHRKLKSRGINLT